VHLQQAVLGTPLVGDDRAAADSVHQITARLRDQVRSKLDALEGRFAVKLLRAAKSPKNDAFRVVLEGILENRVLDIDYESPYKPLRGTGAAGAALNLSAASSQEAAKEVDAVVLAPALLQAPAPTGPAAPENSGMILNYAILNGALEILPETMATMAILPLQMKMVYRIGKSHGVELDRSRITEFLAVAGVGIGSQMVEGFARKFLGGLGKKIGGKLVGKAANQLAGSGLTFATTYALGHLAEKYHGGGRKLDTNSARALFESLKSQASELHTRHLPDIQAKARTITPSSILQMVTGSGPA
jgi:uncharacterized protein (DUF697 family)